MFGRNQISDKELLKTVNKKLVRTGSQSKLTANILRGRVTLTGSIRYESQRRPILKAVSSVPGVQQVTDQLQLAAR